MTELRDGERILTIDLAVLTQYNMEV